MKEPSSVPWLQQREPPGRCKDGSTREFVNYTPEPPVLGEPPHVTAAQEASKMQSKVVPRVFSSLGGKTLFDFT